MIAPLEKPLIMGIINSTADSFSGDGLLPNQTDGLVENVLAQVQNFIDNGVDILDIGGESTRPDAQPVTFEEEYQRVIPAIEAIHQKFPDVTLSIDTMKAKIAEAAIQAGASIINDVTAGTHDENMSQIASKYQVKIVLMHNSAKMGAFDKSAKIGTSYQAERQADIMAVIIDHLQIRIDAMCRAGVHYDNIILDPGIGFGKTVTDNLRIINQLERLQQFKLPILLGASRKSFIGQTLDVPIDERMIGSVISAVMGAMHGANIIRVHDVRQTNLALNMWMHIGNS